jgi:predicted metal-dependent hydrolase
MRGCRHCGGDVSTLTTAEHERPRDAPAHRPARRTARHTRTIRHAGCRAAYARAVSSEDVEVRRSRRRRRTVSAYRDGGRTVVLIPASFSAAEEARWVERMLARLTAGERRRQSSDEALAARAGQLSRRYLGGHARPTSVRWVSTMGRRWASCTPAEGTIRVSDRLRDVPDHVLDYVLLHELAHLLVPGHGPAFWRLLASYPRLERARGFLDGLAHAEGLPPEGDDDVDPVDGSAEAQGAAPE